MALNTFWESSSACSMSHHSDFIPIHGKKKTQLSHLFLKNWCKSSGYIKSLKSYRIKASTQKKNLSHAEDSSSIIQSSSWNTVWSWYHHTAHISGSTAAPRCTWLETEAGRLPVGLCPTCFLLGPRAAGSHLVSLCNRPAAERAYCSQKLQLSVSYS